MDTLPNKFQAPKKHVAKTGAKAGQWVNCTAENCRNGGTHIKSNDLYAAKYYHEEKTGEKLPRLGDVPVESVEEFQKLDSGRQTALREADGAKRTAVYEKNLAAKRKASSRNAKNNKPALPSEYSGILRIIEQNNTKLAKEFSQTNAWNFITSKQKLDKMYREQPFSADIKAYQPAAQEIYDDFVTRNQNLPEAHQAVLSEAFNDLNVVTFSSISREENNSGRVTGLNQSLRGLHVIVWGTKLSQLYRRKSEPKVINAHFNELVTYYRVYGVTSKPQQTPTPVAAPSKSTATVELPKENKVSKKPKSRAKRITDFFKGFSYSEDI